MHAQFYGSFNRLLVTSWLNWSRHCMLVVSFAIWYEMIQAMRAPVLCPFSTSFQIITPLVEIATWLPNPNPSPTPNPKPTNTRGVIIWQRSEFGTTPAPLCVYWRARAASTVQFPSSFDSRLTLKWSWSARLKRLLFDVLVKTFCDWINALFVKKKRDRISSYEWGGQP